MTIELMEGDCETDMVAEDEGDGDTVVVKDCDDEGVVVWDLVTL